MWNRKPKFLVWHVKTWEHAALVPKSFGVAPRVRDCRRILPHEITDPIYVALAKEEEKIFRLTEPVPPFDARLLRETARLAQSENGEKINALSIETIYHRDSLFGRPLCDVIPNWDAVLEDALSTRLTYVETNMENFATEGLPRGFFPVNYGYRIHTSIIEGTDADRKLETHRALLMDCIENVLPPGALRDCMDGLLR